LTLSLKQDKSISGVPVDLAKISLSAMGLIKVRALNPIALQLILQEKYDYVDVRKLKTLLFVMEAIWRFVNAIYFWNYS
jgi:hypothetical protein